MPDRLGNLETWGQETWGQTGNLGTDGKPGDRRETWGQKPGDRRDVSPTQGESSYGLTLRLHPSVFEHDLDMCTSF
jgi:hypothetical protein